MKKLLNLVRRAPKRSGLLAMIAAAVTVPAVLLAWGPDRPTYTMANPANHVTFNSITDNARHGDERNFVQIRNFTDNGTFGENVNLQVGKEYEVYVFYHNNASTHLNTEAQGYKGIAKDTYMRVQMPATVNAGTDARVTGVVGASNATPASVWDEAYGKNTSASAVALRYVQNSAKITSNGAVNGQAIDLTKLASANGALLGYDSLNGKLPGCSEFSGYVTYRFKVDQPNFEVTKDVSKAGANDYSDKVSVAPGSNVDYKIKYKNIGTMAQENVTIKDVLPTGVKYVPGSTYFSSSKTNNQWTAANSDALTTNGIDFGAFAPNAALYVKFTGKVVSNDELAKCDTNILINKAYANTPNGSKHDTATVETKKECKTEKVKACNTETGVIEMVEKGKENTAPYTTDLSKCVKIKACNTKTGQIEMVLPGKANTPPYTTDLSKCDKPAPEKVSACNTETGVIEKVEKGKENTAPYTTDFSKCADVEVCDESTGNIITVPKKDADKYGPVDSDKCKPVTPPVTPETPTELPTTGAGDAIQAIFGLGSLTAAGYYYIASRRN